LFYFKHAKKKKKKKKKKKRWRDPKFKTAEEKEKKLKNEISPELHQSLSTF